MWAFQPTERTQLVSNRLSDISFTSSGFGDFSPTNRFSTTVLPSQLCLGRDGRSSPSQGPAAYFTWVTYQQSKLTSTIRYPLVNVYITMERSTIF